jgi:hypothetical protein
MKVRKLAAILREMLFHVPGDILKTNNPGYANAERLYKF